MWRSAILMSGVLLSGSAFAAAAPASYLALGDSYTIGEAVAESGRWPVQLAALLRADGFAIGEPQIIARTGWTTDELNHAIDQARLQPPYALVSLLIGVNNQYRGRPLAEYRTQFVALLKRALELAGDRPEHVFVLSIPDWGITPFAQRGGRDSAHIGSEIDAFNTVARHEAGQLGVIFIDITGLSRRPGAQPEMLAADGLHPSAAQYRLWAAAAAPAVREMIAHGDPQTP